MNISIVIPNFNGEDLLRNNLPKVIKVLDSYKLGKKELIIVDDCSTDNSIEEINKIKKLSERTVIVHILQNTHNLGFARSVNKGVRVSSGDIIILLNTDTVPEPNFLSPLLKHFDDEKVFAVGCMDKSIENKETVLRGRGLGVWKRGFLMHRRGEVDKNNTLWVSGGSGAFRKSIWDKLGGFNELYTPFYWEDIDLSYRALKSGFKIIFEAESMVTHEHEKGAIKNEFSKEKIEEISYRNQFIFSWSNATDYSLQFSELFWLPYHLAKAVSNKNTAFIKGFFAALIKLPKIIGKSLRFQKLFVKSDREVINGLSD